MRPSGRSGHADLPQSRALRQTKGNQIAELLRASGRPKQAGHRAQKDHPAKRTIKKDRRQVLRNTQTQTGKIKTHGHWLMNKTKDDQATGYKNHWHRKKQHARNLLQQKRPRLHQIHIKIMHLLTSSSTLIQKIRTAANSPDTFYTTP